MEKFTYNIKFPPVMIRVTVGRVHGGPFVVLNYNAVYKGIKHIAYLPMAPSKMEIWLTAWAKSNQTLLTNLFNGRTERWKEILEKV